MRRKTLITKTLSVVLCAALIATSSNAPAMMTVANAETVSVSGNDVQDDGDGTQTVDSPADAQTPDEGQNAADTEENVQDDAQTPEEGTKEETEDAEAESPADTDEAAQTEEASDDEEEWELDADQAKVTDGEAAVSLLIKDAALRQALLDIYNDEVATGTEKIEASAFKLKHLKKIKDVSLTKDRGDFSAIKDATGIGYVEQATTIDLSGTGILTIGEAEFANNVNLKTIVLPDALEGFGSDAFRNCTALDSIDVKTADEMEKRGTLPSSLVDTKVGSNVFYGCTALKSINLPDLKNGAALQNAVGLFAGCTALDGVGIPASVTVIPNKAFYMSGNANTEGGMSVTIAEGSQLNSILDGAFQCANMEYIDLGKCADLSVIGNEAFSAAVSKEKKSEKSAIPLVAIRMPESISGSLKIGNDAFFRAPLANMFTADTVYHQLQNEGTAEVVIPDYVTSLGAGAFYNNEAVKKLTLSANLDAIRGFTFDGCKNLETVTQSTVNGECKIASIGNAAFRNTTALSDADFLQDMNHLTVIGEESISATGNEVRSLNYLEKRNSSYKYGSEVFTGSKIASAVLPASLRTVNSRSFYKATALESVTWKSDTVAEGDSFTINSEAFSGCTALARFVYPKTTIANKTTTKKETFVIAERAFAGDSVLYNFNEEGVNDPTGSKNALPATLTEVKREAFCECSGLPAMKITDHVSGGAPKLGDKVFKKCIKLTSAELPSSLETIPLEFYYDAALTEFPTFANNKNSITSIGQLAFFGNEIVTLDLRNLKKLNILGAGAFAYVNTIDAKDGERESKSYVTAPLKKVYMPDQCSAMVWGSALFQGAKNLNTVATTDYDVDGVAYIPEYVANESCGSDVFSGTDVSKAHWGYTDNPSSKRKWTKIPAGMFNATPVTDFTACTLPASDLKSIGKMAYMGCDLQTLDLTPYVNLEETGDAAFANCFYLKSVKLPDANNKTYRKVSDNMFRVGFFGDIVTGSPTYFSLLTEVDFGAVTELGNYSFATCNGKNDSASNSKAEDVWQSSLAALDFSKTSVKTIGNGAFKGNNALKSANFGGVETIGNNAFQQCVSLDLTATPLSDSITQIGEQAFYKDESLGKVTFGKNLTKIGKQAFAECAVIDDTSKPKTMVKGSGLTAVDFTNATKLTTIIEKAFNQTAIESFDLTTVPVTEIPGNTVSSCPYLKEINLGESVKIVKENAAAGCPALQTFSLYSTTTMNKKTFNDKGVFADADGKQTTQVATMTIKVLPVELNVGLGSAMKFPYYVNQIESGAVAAEFSEMHIGTELNTDASIKQYVKVRAMTSGYYLNKYEKGFEITEPEYFEKVELANASQMEYKVNGVTVRTFEIEGLKPTPEGVTIPFTVTNTYTFSVSGMGDVSNTFSSTFDMKVCDIAYYPVIYTDQARTSLAPDVHVDTKTGLSTGNTTIRLSKTNQSGDKTFYYDIKTTMNSNWQPPSGTIVIETSDPKVVTSNATKISDTKWEVKAEYTASVKNASDITKNKSFKLVPMGTGDAVVTIYPKERPDKAVKWNVHVRSDIKDMALSVPNEYRNGMQKGDKFQVLDSVTMYKNQVAKRADGTLSKLSAYTDNKISFTSDKPAVASVAGDGTVTIQNVTTTKEKVKITATVNLSDGSQLKKELSFDVAYPPLRGGAQVETESGAVVTVTGTPNAQNKTGSVTFVKPAEGATTVTIPDTMVVNGITCRVTEIKDGAFKDNKTITSVTLGTGITKVKKEMFKGCTKLQSVTLKGKVTEIGNSAFEGCTSLKKITIPKTVKTIGEKAFYNCKKLTGVTISSSAALEAIGASAFQKCAALTKITIPKKTKTIGNKAFYGCKKLKTVTFHKKANLDAIGDYAFATCVSIVKFTIPYKVTKIGKRAFYKDSKLKEVTIKTSKLTTVGSGAFTGVNKKAVIKVPRKKYADYKKLLTKKGKFKVKKV